MAFQTTNNGKGYRIFFIALLDSFAGSVRNGPSRLNVWRAFSIPGKNNGHTHQKQENRKKTKQNFKRNKTKQKHTRASTARFKSNANAKQNGFTYSSKQEAYMWVRKKANETNYKTQEKLLQK